MRLKQWCAVLLAALVMALVLLAQPRTSVAGANDDVQFLQPPDGENGDPDTPDGHGRFITTGYLSFCGVLSGRLFILTIRMAPAPSSRPVGASVARVRAPKAGSVVYMRAIRR